METRRRKKLAAAGWRTGSVQEFLGLTVTESVLIEMKLSLAQFVRVQRQRSNLSQSGLAARLGSSQSRVAKLEAGDPAVSLDLMVRAAIAAGGRPADVIKALTPKRRARRAS